MRKFGVSLDTIKGKWGLIRRNQARLSTKPTREISPFNRRELAKITSFRARIYPARSGDN